MGLLIHLTSIVLLHRVAAAYCYLLLRTVTQKNVKSAKGAQPLFLDLVPAMPMTPQAKGGGTDDSSRGFASQEAVTALAETLAKRDAEVSHLSRNPHWQAAAPVCTCTHMTSNTSFPPPKKPDSVACYCSNA